VVVAAAAVVLLGAVGLGGCARGGDGDDAPPLVRDLAESSSTSTSPTTSAPISSTSSSTAATTSTTTSTTTTRPVTVLDTTPGPAIVVEVAYRLERRTTDEATADFEAVAEATLSDARGWSRAGFRLVRRDDAPYLVVLAEGDEVDRLCLPYDTYGQYSCQNGPVVALNADRWRTATPKWTGDLATYRQMLVNHEVGHLLGLHHPRPQCPHPGQAAPVMNQQSTELDGCLPNPWPLPDEVALAARHDQPLAPGPDR
jgi:hypothetical protein